MDVPPLALNLGPNVLHSVAFPSLHSACGLSIPESLCFPDERSSRCTSRGS